MDHILTGTHENEIFSNLKLHNEDLTSSDFTDCVFDHCEIVLAKFTDCGLRNVTFKDCKLVGIDFTKCKTNFFEVSFKDSLVDTCNFSALKLKRIPFLHCTLRETRFVGTTLTEADFEDSDLEGALFHQCNLEKANFKNAKNYSIDPTTNTLKGATFSLPEAISLLLKLNININ
ncbi:MAG: pentapeptide repeat-containing protein [Candidatus Uhrbacteria bacterium]